MPRKGERFNPVPEILIVCEGKETEKQYFDAFRVARVKPVVYGLGKNTVSLVKEAIKLKAKGEYKQVWCVFDIDDFCVDQVNEAIRLAKANKIKPVYSNQSFELWFLLHFDFIHTAIDRKQYLVKLSEKLGVEYKKSLPNMYLRLSTRQKDAITNAQKLMKKYSSPDPCRDNPSTTVYQLVEELKKYTPDSRR